MPALSALISELQSKISFHEKTNPNVSKAAVGWHIEHSLLTMNLIVYGLSRSNPSAYRPEFDIRRIILMLSGKIPRGKIKAPAAVQPKNQSGQDALQQHILVARENLKRLELLHPEHFFTHPFLGDFKLRAAIKFICIHTKHHLQIINDIIEAN